ncbi:MAG: alkaline phosphatase [Bacteroidetes bacterium]|nr:alkaline phosphatase [Bacteroidota bacterium]
MYKFFFVVISMFFCFSAFTQMRVYTVANAHSHNDYENTEPFQMAYEEQFGSIEADIFLHNNELIVAHDPHEVLLNRTLDKYYLEPLAAAMKKNNGYVYPDNNRQLQMLIDIKTDAVPTLDKLVAALSAYPTLINNPSLKWVISGSRPDPSKFTSYPSFILFDGELPKEYDASALKKIDLLSDDFKRYSAWNGKSIIPDADKSRLRTAIAKAHGLHKPVRFWNAPDMINAWSQLMDLDVDYINTDRVKELSAYFNKERSHFFTAKNTHSLYKPTYASDRANTTVKNVILLIGDGTGLPQLYSGYTANKGALNIFQMRSVGLSKTSSYDRYVTDSAPGATSMSSGVKTKNRYVGVDNTGAKLKLLPQYFEEKKIKTGLITVGDVTDATPADFYAHRAARDSSAAIFMDLATAPIQLLLGSGNSSFNTDLKNLLEKNNYHIVSALDSVSDASNEKWLVMDSKADLSMLNGRGDWLQRAFTKTLNILSRNQSGFFIMAEGAQVDHGGHANNLPYVVTEVLDFDELAGKAMQFADANPETLVIITADHETGGLTLHDGDYKKGYINGQFSTNGHTALPVPVFAYGPQSQLFCGVYENTEIFVKILEAMKIKSELMNK